MNEISESSGIKIKKKYMYGLVIIIIIVAGFYFFNNSSAGVNGNAVNNVNGNTNTNSADAQKITLSMKNGNYYPNIIEVESNKQVEITLDNSIGGCYRSFTIRDLGIAKNSRSAEDKIIFTPTKKGTFRFACSMGMGTGTIIVKWNL